MRIQHNIMAMNAYRNYNTNTSALSKNLEKLSSGYKINRAGDDAAGLAISEKMRAQITGLNAAQKNVKDGISLVKTAEGAMQEIQDMLNRMDYLATQSANGTYDNEVDRANLQKEVDALKSEIDRIADSANFNGIHLLNGDQTGTTSSVEGDVVTVTGIADAEVASKTPAKGVYTVDLSNWKATATADGAVKIKVGGVTVATASVSGATASAAVSLDSTSFTAASTASIGGVEFEVKLEGTTLTLTMKSVPADDFDDNMDVTTDGTLKTDNQGLPGSVKVETPAVKEQTQEYAQGSFTLDGSKIKDGSQIQIGNEVYTFKVGKDSKVSGSNNVVDLSKLTESEIKNANTLAKEASKALSKAAAGNKWFKVTSPNDDGTVHLTEKILTDKPYKNDMVGTENGTKDDDADWNGTGEGAQAMVRFSATGGMGKSSTSGGLVLQIGDTSDDYNRLNVVIGDMHTSALGIDGLDISNPTSAAAAIQTIKDAINNVSSVRGDLGAVQNRLEHTANNLSVMAENIQDAESTIRDTDVAEEMMAYTKNNILIQSAQAMLAQANAVPQGVLQLLG